MSLRKQMRNGNSRVSQRFSACPINQLILNFANERNQIYLDENQEEKLDALDLTAADRWMDLLVCCGC